MLLFSSTPRFWCAAQPSFSVKPQDQKVGLNGVASFECHATGNPPPSVFWAREGSQMLMFPDNSFGHIHVTGQGTLQIRGVQKEDAGYYVCSALSVAGSATIRAFLQVTSVDDIPPPIIQIGPANQTLPVGSVAMLPCRAIGNPAPRIRWYKDGLPLQTNHHLVIVQTGSLKIDSKHRHSLLFTLACSLTHLSQRNFDTFRHPHLPFRFANIGHWTLHVHGELREWRDIVVSIAIGMYPKSPSFLYKPIRMRLYLDRPVELSAMK